MLSMQLPVNIFGRFATFSVAGVINTFIGVTVIFLASFVGSGPLLANAIGYGAGFILSFTLNSKVTFRERSVNRAVFLRFLFAFVVAFSVNVAIVLTSVHLLHLGKWLSSVAGTPFYVILFFLMCEYWVYRE